MLNGGGMYDLRTINLMHALELLLVSIPLVLGLTLNFTFIE